MKKINYTLSNGAVDNWDLSFVESTKRKFNHINVDIINELKEITASNQPIFNRMKEIINNIFMNTYKLNYNIMDYALMLETSFKHVPTSQMNSMQQERKNKRN